MKYDELIGKLRDCDDYRCDDCELKDEELCNPILMEKAANAIEELQKPQWIPVAERMPELRMWESGSLASSNVLFVTEDKTIHIGYVMEGFHIGDNGCLKIDRWFTLGGYRIENVTHWMPSPSTEGLNET